MSSQELTKNFLNEVGETLLDREELYGDPTKNFEDIAKIWSIVLGKEVTPGQVAMCMIGTKLARESHSRNYDNLVDIVGYTAIALRVNVHRGFNPPIVPPVEDPAHARRDRGY